MKTALVFFRTAERDFDGEYYGRVVGAFKSGGIDVSTVEILSRTDDHAFRTRIDEFKDTVDNLIIVGGEEVSFDLKDVIAQKLDTALAENENARIFLDAVGKNDGVEYSDDFALMPIEATVIPNLKGAFQGFIVDVSEFTVVVLPERYSEFKPMCDKYVLPYLENKYGIKSNRLILKYFGDIPTLDDVLSNAEAVYDGLKCNIYQKHGDVSVDLLFDDGVDEVSRAEVIRFIVGGLKENVYAEFDTTLGERLFDVLKLKNLKLSVAESFTGGRVVSEVIKNPGASAFVHEGVVTYSNESKVKRLNVNKADLDRHGAVSAVVAYQMAAGLLRSGNCDVAVATTGIAGPKSDDTEKPVGLCYIAVGMKDGVHTYKLNLTGNREEITETAKNTALFLAIKKLKNV
ncbi:MAG: nicotinamide-nucleotide amidohydrolase family protein [Clostridia bacterium]|nr:nicotinamide-nucleotide amidohydrolase family protein [Clostridia bacterium]